MSSVPPCDEGNLTVQWIGVSIDSVYAQIELPKFSCLQIRPLDLLLYRLNLAISITSKGFSARR
jgi:hypothetical protein